MHALSRPVLAVAVGVLLLVACDRGGVEDLSIPPASVSERPGTLSPMPAGTTASPGGTGSTPGPPPGPIDGTADATPPQPLPQDAWSPRAEAPVPLTEVAAAPASGQIWVAGGLDDDGQAVRTVQVYDPTFDTWSGGPPLPEPVHHSALVSAGNELYLVGGYAGSSFEQPTSAVHRFDAAAGGWVEAPPLPQARAAGAAAWDGTRILYGGGVGQDGLAGDVYALGGDGWQAIGTLSEPREHLGAAGDGQGRVWFVGGRRGGLDTNLGTVDLVDGDAVRRLGDLPTPRGGVAAFWSAPTGACLAGGEAPGGTFAEVECMDDTGGVRVLPDLATPRHGLGAAFVDGFAYILLGGPQPGLSTSGAVETLPISPGG